MYCGWTNLETHDALMNQTLTYDIITQTYQK